MTQTLSGSSLDYTVRLFYADLIEEAYLDRTDPGQVYARVRVRSWLFQQLDVALAGVSTSLVSGFEVLGTDDGLRVRDLRTDEDLRLLDLGVCGDVAAGDWLLGRVLPIGMAPELIFDLRPVVVDEVTAREVAQARELGQWVAAVKAALVEGRVSREAFELEEPLASASAA